MKPTCLTKKASGRQWEVGSTVLHTASPFVISKIKDPHKELIQPALEGTRNVLSLANEFPDVKNIVVTSSAAAIYGDASDIHKAKNNVFTEDDWNTTSNEKHNPYQYSKTVAEQEAWKIAKEQKQWKLTTINPTFVMGPSLSKRIDSASVDTMRSLISGKFTSGVPGLYFGVVDVRDVAKAHILAATKDEAIGRHLCVA